LDLSRLARSTTSDALDACDPKHLLPLVKDLLTRCPNLCHADEGLNGITRRIIAADGTYLATLADVTWALHHTKSNGRTQGQVRANVQLDVANWAPQVISPRFANNRGVALFTLWGNRAIGVRNAPAPLQSGGGATLNLAHSTELW
jgi:hypothetical protein